MPSDDNLETRYGGLRSLLRVLGPLLIVAGALFVITAMVDFFSAFSGPGTPTRFWMAFVGVPLIGIGQLMTKFGYLREAAGYVAGEVTPVAKDVVNYLGEGTKETLTDVARAVGAGLAEARGEGASEKECPHCHARNEAEAGFCSSCGAAFGQAKRCPACGHTNTPAARFCDRCGREFAP